MLFFSPRSRSLQLMVGLATGCLLTASCGSKSSSAGGSGGNSGSGGNAASGGNSGSGGNPGSGGHATGSGGQTSGSGGRAASGGQTGSGGATTSSGGKSGSGGASASGGSGGGGSGGASGMSDPGTAPSAVTGLKIDPNPMNVLSCFVSWTTDKAASSTVQFGQNGYQWEISDATLVTDHKVLVIGMHAQQMYSIKAISANSGGSVSGEGMFMTGTLPATIPNGTVMIHDATRMLDGWTLMNVQKGDGTTDARSAYPPQAVMYDADGQAVWYFIDGTNPDIGGAVSTQLTDKGVLIGPTWNQQQTTGTMPIEVDFAGNTIWQCSTSVCGGSHNFSHHAGKLSNGDYVLIEYITKGGAQSPIYREVSPDNQIVWSLDWSTLIPPPSGATGDWCHANSITIDIAKDTVWANCRWIGLMKTSYQNPTKQWLLQGTYSKSFNLGDYTFSPPEGQYSDTHNPEIHDDGTVCFYDNGGYAQAGIGGPGPGTGGRGGSTTPTQYHSRAVEYQLDEAKKTATLIWEYPGKFTPPDSWYTTEWYSPFWGDVDRLSNGNHLITGGIRSPTVESRVFEVTKDDGKVVWEFRFPPDYGVYRSQRLSPPPLVHPVK